MYTFKSRTRFSETDSDGRLTMEAIVDYFQDCSTFQSEDLGIGFSYLQPMGLTWVLSYWQIEVEEYPALGEELTIGTIPYEFKGFLGKRNFCIDNGAGKRIVSADSLWTLLDVEKQFPGRMTEKILTAYPREEKLPMDYLPRKISVSGKKRQEETFSIQKHHLDRNQHVNNGQYIKLAAAYLPAGLKISRLRAEYKAQARYQDVVYPWVYEEADRIVVCLCDGEENPYVIVEYCS